MQVLIIVYRCTVPVTVDTTTKQWSQRELITIPERDLFTKATVKTNLFLWAANELSFLGLLQRDQMIYGMVSDPIGKIYRVAVGDKIGLGNSKITAINERGITTTNQADNIYREE